MPTNSTIEKYQRILALSVSGATEGERAAAAAALRRMETDYPNIRSLAAAQAEGKKQKASDAHQGRPSMSWSDFFQQGQQALASVVGVAEKLAAQEQSAVMARRAKISAEGTEKGGVVFRVTLSRRLLREASELSDSAFQDFTKNLGSHFATSVMEILSESSSEGEENEE